MPKIKRLLRACSVQRWRSTFIVSLSAALLLACGSLPTIHPDMAIQPGKKVQLDGKKGLLSSRQSQAILDKVENKSGDETGIFERHLALEEAITNTPLVLGNKVDLLVDGKATYDAMFAAILQAQDHINMETFILEADEVGQKFADALIERQVAGVQVNLIYDSFGSINTPAEYFDRLTSSGISVLQFNPINPTDTHKSWQVNQRDHRKLLIVDGKIAFVGGINISSVYSKGSSGSALVSSGNEKNPATDAKMTPWRDTHLRVEGPVVSDFQKLFLEAWQNQQGDALAPRNYMPELKKSGDHIVRAIGSSPQEEFSMMYITLLSAINSAETRIYLTNAYFVPDPQLLQGLKDAVSRGVDVKLILPSTTDSSLVYFASRSFYTELLKAGVQIYETQDALLHAKTALIDGVWSTVGSTNLDWRSFLHNYEINAVILGHTFGEQMHAMFQQDLQSAKLVTLEAWKKRPLSARIKEKMARIWARWL